MAGAGGMFDEYIHGKRMECFLNVWMLAEKGGAFDEYISSGEMSFNCMADEGGIVNEYIPGEDGIYK